MPRYAILIVILLVTFHLMAPPVQAGPQVEPHSRSEAAKIIADLRRIVTPDGIERLEAVNINGVDQWISIRGRDRRNPVLLVVHGGPGWVAMPTSWYFAQGWDEYFTVIQWDQRGAGKTYNANDPKVIAETLTIQQMQGDLDGLIEWTRSELGVDKIFLLGHSWGSILGLEVARRKPEWLHAYIGAGQVIDMRESERRGWAWAIGKAQETGNEAAIAELESLAPYAVGRTPVPTQNVLRQRKWVNAFGGASYNRPDSSFESAAIALSPDYTDEDVRNVWEAQAVSVDRLFPSILEVDMSSISDLNVPVILLLGRHDINVSSAVAAEWYAQLNAPFKRLVWFEHSAHEMMVEEPGKTFLTLVHEVRPLASPPLRATARNEEAASEIR